MACGHCLAPGQKLISGEDGEQQTFYERGRHYVLKGQRRWGRAGLLAASSPRQMCANRSVAVSGETTKLLSVPT